MKIAEALMNEPAIFANNTAVIPLGDALIRIAFGEMWVGPDAPRETTIRGAFVMHRDDARGLRDILNQTLGE